MIKGSQKQMIVLRTSSSRYFDEAYFVLRREVSPKKGSRKDLLHEAERILNESGLLPRASAKRWRTVALFFSGLFVGAAIALLFCFLL